MTKRYVHSSADRSLCQYDSLYARNFYLHDGLGSVRQVIDTDGDVVNRYTYEPFGEAFDDQGEVEESIANPFKFTGQYYDSEIIEYYLRARQYNPHIGRFTSRDPIAGKFEEPLTLHKYLYCGNNSINWVDPLGLWYEYHDIEDTQRIVGEATELVGKWWKLGPFQAFGFPWYKYDFKGSHDTFQLNNAFMQDSEFGNYLAGYSTYYNYVEFGDVGVRFYGHLFALIYDHQLDDRGSKYFISAGILKARDDRGIQDKRRGSKIDFVMAKYDLFHGYDRILDKKLNSEEFWQEAINLVTFWNSCTE